MPSCQEKRSHSSESGPVAPFHWGTRLPLEVHSCAYCLEDLGWRSAETHGKVGLVPWVLERSNPASQRCPPHLVPADCRVSTLAHPGVLETIRGGVLNLESASGTSSVSVPKGTLDKEPDSVVQLSPVSSLYLSELLPTFSCFIYGLLVCGGCVLGFDSLFHLGIVSSSCVIGSHTTNLIFSPQFSISLH